MATKRKRTKKINPKYSPYWGRRASDSKIMKMSESEAVKVSKRPAAKSALDAPSDWLLVWKVPDIYKNEAKWRIEHGWIDPVWDWAAGPLPGGVAQSNPKKNPVQIKMTAIEDNMGNLTVFPESKRWSKHFGGKDLFINADTASYYDFLENYIPRSKHKEIRRPHGATFMMDEDAVSNLYVEGV